MCRPQPSHVGFPQVWQFTRWHMLAVLLSLDTAIGAQALRGLTAEAFAWHGARSNRRLSQMQIRPKW